MNKCKIIRKKGETKLVIKGEKGQQINENEVYAINTGKVEGVLHLDTGSSFGKFHLVYTMTGLITLREYLHTPVNKESFAGMLSVMLKHLKTMEQMLLNQHAVIFDVDFVMVNPITHSLYFIYIPIQSYESGYSLREFFLSILSCCTFVSGEDTGYVKRYIEALNKEIKFSSFELEQYLETLQEKVKADREQRYCPKCHAKLLVGRKYCISCGAMLSVQESEKKGVYVPEVSMQKKTAENIGEQTLQKPMLTRMKTGEKVSISKTPFEVGKDEKCNYVIRDNKAISRNHADIVEIGNGKYGVIDRGSTNGTYLCDTAVSAKIPFALENGAKLRLADEEFIFNVVS